MQSIKQVNVCGNGTVDFAATDVFIGRMATA